MTDGKEDLYGMTLREITAVVSKHELPGYTSGQIADWLYKKRISSVAEMSNLAKTARQKLEANYFIGLNAPSQFQLSADGTKKYLFKVKNEKYIEAVFIPETDRTTLCLSSQIGCKMGCEFCMTARQGFQGNLTSGEILNQVVSLPERDLLTNYVFMGMGEPLANTENVLKSLEIMTSSYGFGFSPTRITVSTIGIIPGLEQILEQSRCHIAVSLHSPFEQERQQLMPVQKIFPIKRVIDLLRNKSYDRQRRLSFEYIMFKGINDTARHINGLTRLLNGLRCRINLIRYHPIPGAPFESSDEDTIMWFRNRLNEKGILTTLRASRGKDIFAACGMLSTKVQTET
jgi:23S rRNA (adenine2503-C2)-methyltransferase